jgi:hypothetical protein
MATIGRYAESPPFRYVLNAGDLPAGAIYSKDYEDAEDEEAKYLPFNLMTISNFSAQKLEVHIGDSITKVVFPLSVQVIEVDAIYRWRVKNIDIVDNDDMIEIILEKRLTERELLKRIAMKMEVI